MVITNGLSPSENGPLEAKYRRGELARSLLTTGTVSPSSYRGYGWMPYLPILLPVSSFLFFFKKTHVRRRVVCMSEDNENTPELQFQLPDGGYRLVYC